MHNSLLRATSYFYRAVFVSLITVSSEVACDSTNDRQINRGPSKAIRLSDGGPIIGQCIEAVNKKMVTEYLGIPYAETPVGQKRFRAPVRKAPWKTPLNATKLPNSCQQVITNNKPYALKRLNPNTPLSEDCLYLNIWVPDCDAIGNSEVRGESIRSFEKHGMLLPVMVWIHGGGFSVGTSTLDIYDGKIFSTQEKIIIVSMNYRVNSFGFMYLGIPEVAGNMGMLDQLEALKWIHENIVHFGGDPDSVTLFGEGAGASSVSLHSISPLSQPLFKRFILQSGSALDPWAINSKQRMLERSFSLAQFVGCSSLNGDSSKNLNTSQIVECLQRVPAELLLKYRWQSDKFLETRWAPIVDGRFMVEEPRLAIESGRFKKTQAIAGSILNEGNFFLVYHLIDVYKRSELFNRSEFVSSQAQFEKIALLTLPSNFSRCPSVVRAILLEYSPNQTDVQSVDYQEALDKLVGDHHFTCNTNEFARQFEKHGGTLYSYLFAHQSSSNLWPKWMGVLRGTDIHYVFGEPLNGRSLLKYNEEEAKLSRRIMGYWANFARTGNPNINPDEATEPDNWPVFSKMQDYLVVSTKTSVGFEYRKRQCTFWNDYMPTNSSNCAHSFEVFEY